jgi:hypothetical protein
LHFTVINMGREGFALIPGEMIVTLLFVELAGNAQADYHSRRGDAPPAPPAQALDQLASDFLHVEQRAKEIAEHAASDAVKDTNWRVNIGVTLITVIVTIAGLAIKGCQDASLQEVRKDFEVLKEELKIKAFGEQLQKLNDRVKSLEETSAASSQQMGRTNSPGSNSSKGPASGETQRQ